jgi:hypothetical protein
MEGMEYTLYVDWVGFESDAVFLSYSRLNPILWWLRFDWPGNAPLIVLLATFLRGMSRFDATFIRSRVWSFWLRSLQKSLSKLSDDSLEGRCVLVLLLYPGLWTRLLLTTYLTLGTYLCIVHPLQASTDSPSNTRSEEDIGEVLSTHKDRHP